MKMVENSNQIHINVARLLAEVPPNVTIVAVCKTRSVADVQAAFDAGIRHFGQNYVQEAQSIIPKLSFQAEWHFIGHLQRNKVVNAVSLFQLIETVDSIPLTQELEKRCAQQEKQMPILIEINSGYEDSKSGTLPEEVDELVQFVGQCPHLHLEGLMTMGPRFGDAEEARPYYQSTWKIFERLRSLKSPAMNLHILSMGMSNSYQVAIEEGATMIRLGTAIFGERG